MYVSMCVYSMWHNSLVTLLAHFDGNVHVLQVQYPEPQEASTLGFLNDP